MSWKIFLLGFYVQLVLADLEISNLNSENLLNYNQIIQNVPAEPVLTMPEIPISISSDDKTICPTENLRLNGNEFLMNKDEYTSDEIENFLNNFNGIEVLESNNNNDEKENDGDAMVNVDGNGKRDKRTLSTVCVKVKSKKRSEEPILFCKKVPTANLNEYNNQFGISSSESDRDAAENDANLKYRTEDVIEYYEDVVPNKTPVVNNNLGPSQYHKFDTDGVGAYKPVRPLTGKPDGQIYHKPFVNSEMPNNYNENNFNFPKHSNNPVTYDSSPPSPNNIPVHLNENYETFPQLQDKYNTQYEYNHQKPQQQQPVLNQGIKSQHLSYPKYSAKYQAFTGFNLNTKDKDRVPQYMGLVHKPPPPASQQHVDDKISNEDDEIEEKVENFNSINENDLYHHHQDYAPTSQPPSKNNNPSNLEQKKIQALKLININYPIPTINGPPIDENSYSNNNLGGPNLQSINYARFFNGDKNGGKNWFGNLQGNFQVYAGKKPTNSYSNPNYGGGFNQNPYYPNSDYSNFDGGNKFSGGYQSNNNRFQNFFNKVGDMFRSRDIPVGYSNDPAQLIRNPKMGNYYNVPTNHENDYPNGYNYNRPYNFNQPIPRPGFNNHKIPPQYIPNHHSPNKGGNQPISRPGINHHKIPPQYIPNHHSPHEQGDYIETEDTDLDVPCSNNFVVSCEPIVTTKPCSDNTPNYNPNFPGYNYPNEYYGHQHNKLHQQSHHNDGPHYQPREEKKDLSVEKQNIHQEQRNYQIQEHNNGIKSSRPNTQKKKKIVKTIKTVYVTHKGDKTAVKTTPTVKTTSTSTITQSGNRPIHQEQQRTIFETHTTHTSSKADAAASNSETTHQRTHLPTGTVLVSPQSSKEASGSTLSESIAIPNYNTSPFQNRYSNKFSLINRLAEAKLQNQEQLDAGDNDDGDEDNGEENSSSQENSERKPRTIIDEEFFSSTVEPSLEIHNSNYPNVTITTDDSFNSDLQVEKSDNISDEERIIYDLLKRKFQ